MTDSQPGNDDPLSPFQVALAILSILLLASLVVNALGSVPREIARVLQFLDLLVCALLFIDFCNRFARAPDKRRFMRWGWIDLVASIPNVDWLRFGRLARITRIIMILRTVRMGQRLFRVMVQSKQQSAAASALLMVILLITASSITMLLVERTPEANIRTAEDAIWWSMTTITTVGYGDKFPVTTAGRGVAMMLMISGVGLFGVMGGLVASLLLGGRIHRSSSPIELPRVAEQLDRMERQLASLQEQLAPRSDKAVLKGESREVREEIPLSPAGPPRAASSDSGQL